MGKRKELLITIQAWKLKYWTNYEKRSIIQLTPAYIIRKKKLEEEYLD
jgi:hypothetical protein